MGNIKWLNILVMSMYVVKIFVMGVEIACLVNLTARQITVVVSV